jgi:hypothetical protein
MIGFSSTSIFSKILPFLFLGLHINLCCGNDSSVEQNHNDFCQLLQTNDSYNSEDSTSRIHFSVEGGVGFFDSGPQGQFSSGEFLVDEAKAFVEAEIWNNIYFFGELNLITREEEEEDEGNNIHLGELYVEFESVSRFFGKEGLLSLRLGRFDIPFGEEYLRRDAIDNPLISHSISDLWGVDEGVELYGSVKKFEYVFAVQNGGEPIVHDFNTDKAIVGRASYKLSKNSYFSFSAMRTGKIDVLQDKFSELWFANSNLHMIGSPITTTTFQANLVQGNAQINWQSGHVYLEAGQLHYEDDDTASDNSRNAPYFQIEAVENINDKEGRVFYGAGRFSRVTCGPGFFLVGNGNPDLFLFDTNRLTTILWRLSMGIGYRMGKKILLKTEYTIEKGREVNGTERDQENFLGAEVAFKF